MTTPAQIAKHFREIHFGGNWTCSNLKDNLADITWQQATTKIHSLNTIAALVYHMNYYVSAVLKVLKGGELNAHDKYSYDCPPIESEEDWKKLTDKMFAEAQEFASLLEQLPEHKINENIADPKYGNYFRNLHGIIEHTHYHLGQVVIIKKMVQEAKTAQ